MTDKSMILFTNNLRLVQTYRNCLHYNFSDVILAISENTIYSILGLATFSFRGTYLKLMVHRY